MPSRQRPPWLHSPRSLHARARALSHSPGPAQPHPAAPRRPRQEEGPSKPQPHSPPRHTPRNPRAAPAPSATQAAGSLKPHTTTRAGRPRPAPQPRPLGRPLLPRPCPGHLCLICATKGPRGGAPGLRTPGCAPLLRKRGCPMMSPAARGPAPQTTPPYPTRTAPRRRARQPNPPKLRPPLCPAPVRAARTRLPGWCL
jgi:hypothetical protein